MKKPKYLRGGSWMGGWVGGCPSPGWVSIFWVPHPPPLVKHSSVPGHISGKPATTFQFQLNSHTAVEKVWWVTTDSGSEPLVQNKSGPCDTLRVTFMFLAHLVVSFQQMFSQARKRKNNRAPCQSTGKRCSISFCGTRARGNI